MISAPDRSLRRAVFLDRDGVLNGATIHNRKPFPPVSRSELQIAPDALEALTDLKRRAFSLIVVMNQPDVSRGMQRREIVQEVNEALAKALPLDQILVCYHDTGDRCDCRKPRPGLLLQAARERGINRARSFMVGDRWSDIDAGHTAGCQTILIDNAYDEQGPQEKPTATVTSLGDARDAILEMVYQGVDCEPSL